MQASRDRAQVRTPSAQDRLSISTANWVHKTKRRQAPGLERMEHSDMQRALAWVIGQGMSMNHNKGLQCQQSAHCKHNTATRAGGPHAHVHMLSSAKAMLARCLPASVKLHDLTSRAAAEQVNSGAGVMQAYKCAHQQYSPAMTQWP